MHSIVSPRLQPAQESSSCFPVSPATALCNWGEILAATAWVSKLSLGRRNQLSFPLTSVASAHCWGKASGDTSSNAGSLKNHFYPEDLGGHGGTSQLLVLCPLWRGSRSTVELSVSLQLRLVPVTKPDHLFFCFNLTDTLPLQTSGSS